MKLTRKERLELCELSENSFGGRYDWLKYLNTPHYVKEEITANSGKKMMAKVAKWRTFEEVKKMMTGDVVETKTEEVTNEGA